MLDELKDDYTNEMDKAVKASLMQNYLIIGECIYTHHACSYISKLLLFVQKHTNIFQEYDLTTSNHIVYMYNAAFYVYFPPVRSRPIRTLQLGESLVNIKGKWYFDLRKYKTSAKYGPQITELHKNLVCSSILP